jgi:hypothetical protein
LVTDHGVVARQTYGMREDDLAERLQLRFVTA